MRRALFVVTLFILIVAACAPQATATEPQSIIVQRPTPVRATATPTRVQVDLTPAQRAALTSLSGKLGVPVAKIKLVSTEAVTWPDGCLGIVRVGEMCTQAQVPGFKIVLEANQHTYEFHTDVDGSNVRLAEGARISGATEE